jgi:hypothetical protein
MLRSPEFGRIGKGTILMKKTLPGTMFTDPERSRLSMLRTWVLDNEVTEIEMNERQFWNFAHLYAIANLISRPAIVRYVQAPHICLYR